MRERASGRDRNMNVVDGWSIRCGAVGSVIGICEWWALLLQCLRCNDGFFGAVTKERGECFSTLKACYM